jgi:1,4-dihydroxy-2-naphthoate octaprenyltransferase
MMPVEPTLSSYQNPFLRYFFATRPPFLLVTLVACLLGIASASWSGLQLQADLAIITVLLALLTHAAVNVLNDYFDALNGTDDVNTERLYPFTGGSRFIQSGVLSAAQTARFGYALLGAAILGGLWLIAQTGAGLLWLGAGGLLLGWAYSAPPLKLNSRGWGELCVLLGFLGVTLGADFVQRKAFAWQPVITGLPYALLVTNLLFINQFPDRKADMQAGKRHWVARLLLHRAVLGYPLIAVLALLCLLWGVWIGALPKASLLSAFPILFSFVASWHLMHFAEMPALLRPAIQLTLAAMLGHGLTLALILFWEHT